MTTLHQLTAEVCEHERYIAPGSETGLLGLYQERMRQLTGIVPLGDYDDAPVPDEEAEWWRASYRLLEALENLRGGTGDDEESESIPDYDTIAHERGGLQRVIDGEDPDDVVCSIAESLGMFS